MNNFLGGLDTNIVPTSDKIFNEMTLVFDEIKILLSSGNFQFALGKAEFLSQKKTFFILLNKIFGDKNIENFFADRYDIQHLKSLENSEFSLIFDIYKLLEQYFASQYKPLEAHAVIPQIKLLQILETQEENGWLYVSSFFGHDIMFESDNCYENLQKVDLEQYTDEDLQLKMKTLKDFLISKKSKDKELIRFVGFLVKSIRDCLEARNEKSKLIKENEEIQKKNTIVKEIFLNNLHLFDDFILWAKEHINNRSDFNNFASFEDLQKDTETYSSFLQFKNLFASTYILHVLVPYKNLFEKNDSIEEKNYSTILHDLNYLGVTYGKNISEISFFTGFKKGFLLGDIYEFLCKQNEIFPELSSHLTGLLLEEFTNYTTV